MTTTLPSIFVPVPEYLPMRSRASRPMFGNLTISEMVQDDPELARKLGVEIIERPASIPFDPLTQLTTHQQAALLSLRETIASRRVVMKLLEDSQDRYSGSDFAQLRNFGLAEFKPGYRLHQITDRGRGEARSLEQLLCKQFSIHIQSSNTDSGRTNTLGCSCGWVGHVTRNIHASHSAERAFSTHLREVRSKEAINIIKDALKPMAKAEGL